MADADSLTQQGIEALQAGDRAAARKLLTQAVKSDGATAESWWYLSQVMEDPEKVLTCLRYVVRLDPDHAEARARLAAVEAEVAASGGGSKQAPKAAAPADSGDGGFSLPLPDGIPGAPARLSGAYLLDFLRGMFDRGRLLVTQPGGVIDTAEGTWWRVILIGALVGLVAGAALLLSVAFISLRLLNPLSIVVLPLVSMVQAVVAVGAAGVLSHWYLTTQAGGKGALLAHTYLLALAWMLGSVGNALLTLIGGFGLGRALDAISWLQGGGVFSLGLGSLLLTGAALGLLVYVLYVWVQQWGRLHGAAVSQRDLWVAGLLAALVVALVF